MNEKNYALYRLLQNLKESEIETENYWIPSIWKSPEEPGAIINVDPIDFFIDQIEWIFDHPSKEENNQNKTQLTYCMMIRHTTSFDHNIDGKIEISPLNNKFYETGTFLKTIALLPYIKSLGTDILYLLPISEICSVGKKGNLGSPYSYKHPMRLEPRLGEPFLNLSLEEQFAALVEACHLLGIKVVQEFVFRTCGISSDLALEHPDWFYWVKEEFLENDSYAPPKFTSDQIENIKTKVENQDFEDLITPDISYKNLFTEIPTNVKIEGEVPVGFLEDGTRVRIPYAFADWPPNDLQPLWKDVTYFRYYYHPEFNYIAYNTVRMYSKELITNGKKVESLWNFISEIIPHYITKFDIDGAMIDMGHAIPEELLNMIFIKAREKKEDFIFWEENFNVHPHSKEQRYNATLGYLFFDQSDPSKLKEIIKKIEKKEFSLPFFLTPETHNTPRSARFGCDFNKLTFAFNSFLPGIRFILSGFELCDQLPYNTGLNFTAEEIDSITPEKLPLFSISSLPWNTSNIISFIKETNEILKELNVLSESFDQIKIFSLISSNEAVVAFKRKFKDFDIILIANFSNKDQKTFIEGDNSFLRSSEIILGEYCMNSNNEIILLPFGFAVFKNFKQ